MKYFVLFLLLNVCFVGAMEFSISSEPSNAKVWIDGVYTHHLTPSDEVEQKDVIELWGEGKHVLKLVKSGYLLEQEIELKSGERLVLDLVIPEISDSTDDSSSDSCPECEECDDCPKCEECPDCEETIKYIEKIIYVENNTCDIEKVIKPITGNIVYKVDEDKNKRTGVYFLCFALILMVIGLNVKRKYYN